MMDQIVSYLIVVILAKLTPFARSSTCNQFPHERSYYCNYKEYHCEKEVQKLSNVVHHMGKQPAGGSLCQLTTSDRKASVLDVNTIKSLGYLLFAVASTATFTTILTNART